MGKLKWSLFRTDPEVAVKAALKAQEPKEEPREELQEGPYRALPNPLPEIKSVDNRSFAEQMKSTADQVSFQNLDAGVEKIRDKIRAEAAKGGYSIEFDLKFPRTSKVTTEVLSRLKKDGLKVRWKHDVLEDNTTAIISWGPT